MTYACPKCAGKTRVTNVRQYGSKLNEAVMRRRECLDCVHRFTTQEVLVEDPGRQRWSRRPSGDGRTREL